MGKTKEFKTKLVKNMMQQKKEPIFNCLQLRIFFTWSPFLYLVYKKFNNYIFVKFLYLDRAFIFLPTGGNIFSNYFTSTPLLVVVLDPN